MIRPATKDDAKSILPILNQIFDEMQLESMKDVSEAKLFKMLEAAFNTEDYRYSYRHTMVHETDGTVDGLAVGYFAEQEKDIDNALKPFLKIADLSEDTEFFTDVETKPGEWYLDSLAVAPESQGRGIGKKLLDEVIELRRTKKDAKSVSLNVDYENPRARKLYKKIGFVDDGELMIGDHRYHHMIYPLN